jgi:hypothetical protein
MNKVKIEKKYLHLTEEINALDYLEQAYHYIQQTENIDIAWKWVVITLHGALYGFSICALKGTDYARVTTKNRKGVERLISFNEALKRCQDQRWMHMTAMSKHLQLSGQQKKYIKILKDLFRNNFEHYIPKFWSIELHVMPQMTINILNIIRFLALETSPYIHLNQTQKKRLKSIVFQSKRILKQSQLYKELNEIKGVKS